MAWQFLVLCAIALGALGVWWELRRRKLEAVRVSKEDALKHIYNCEARKTLCTVQSLGGQLSIDVNRAAGLLNIMQEEGLVELSDEGVRPTALGREYALRVIRAHRLVETYLADRTGVAETKWHGRAERMEHLLSPADADALSSELGNPTHDPHGDPVPTAEGDFLSSLGQTLLSLSEGQTARVLHVEDEPESVYARLVEEDIFPGMTFRVLEAREGSIRILTEGSEKTLSPLMAGNISVRPLARAEEPDLSNSVRLCDLSPGGKGRVVALSKATRAAERRRWMDLGILPGTIVELELVGPGGDPSAYRIRGAVIALRAEQARHILVEPVGETAA